MHQSGHHAMAILAERVVGLSGRLEIFGADRGMGAAERLGRILAGHEARIIRGDAERQRPLMAGHRIALVLRQGEDALELGQRSDARARLPAPVVRKARASGPTGKRSRRTTTSSCGPDEVFAGEMDLIGECGVVRS